jgi:hypothetical protein
MPLQATSGAASYDGFGGGVVAEPNYIESCFSTYLYTGNGSTQTINNGIDLSTKGGMLWCKIRNTSDAHALFDTARGFPNWLVSNTTGAQNAFGVPDATDMVATTTGFSMKNISSASNSWNSSGNTFASWTFRKQPKFFDVVTYTGDGASSKTISHSLGSVPGCIIVKPVDLSGGWLTYHQSLGNTKGVYLNTTAAQATSTGFWNNTSPTSTQFTVGSTSNDSGYTFVAYVFAHNAGGFGLTGTDNVISCGSFTTDGDGLATISLGYEPQWVLVKNTQGTSDWVILDNMRGWTNTVSSPDARIFPNTSGAELPTGSNLGNPTATGFTWGQAASNTYIYIAIRRGPMKVPTSGTSVFKVGTEAGFVAYPAQPITGGFDDSNAHFIDAVLTGFRNGASTNSYFTDRLRGFSPTTADTANFATRALVTSSTAAEVTNAGINQVSGVVGAPVFIGFSATGSQQPVVNYAFRRAPSFFDVVCYTGTGAAQTLTHNLGTTPELFFTKPRSYASNWFTYSGFAATNRRLYLDQSWGYDNANTTSSNIWNSTAPTATTFTVGGSASTSGQTYVAYLFATCAGVSKVGSYTGNGSSQTINCGFTSSARFVMVKRTDTTGDWYVFDSARGLTGGGDNSLLLNTTGEEDLYNNSDVGPESVGFSVGPTYQGLNASGATYIFLAIA